MVLKSDCEIYSINAELDDAKEIVKITFEEFGDDSDMDPIIIE